MPRLTYKLPMRTLRAILACGACAVLPLFGQSDAQLPGRAAVTSIQGKVELRSLDGRSAASAQPKLHALLELTDSQLQTGAQSACVLSLSNGIGLALAENTTVSVTTYTQAPFSARDESLHYEPSTSTVALQLESGQLALAFEHLSPLSSATVKFPGGRLIPHSGKILIQAASAQHCTISVVSGTASLFPTISRQRVYLSSRAASGVEWCAARSPRSGPLRQDMDITRRRSGLLAPARVISCPGRRTRSERHLAPANRTVAINATPPNSFERE